MSIQRKLVELTNEFHRSACRIIIRAGDRVSPRTIRRIRRELCGSNGCRCADNSWGGRGPQAGLKAAGLWIGSDGAVEVAR